MNNPTHIRVGLAEDQKRYANTDQWIWFEEAADLPLDEALRSVAPKQRFAATVEGGPVDSYAGIYAVRPMWVGVPGASVPVAGITWVGVHPDHRRQGVMSAMMSHHFTQAAADGWAISVLHASEPSIYPRFGYGMAAVELLVELGRGTSLYAPALEQRASQMHSHLTTGTDEGVPERMAAVDRDLATRQPGLLAAEPEFYAREVRPHGHESRDKEPVRVLFAQCDGVDVGYAAFARDPQWPNNRPAGTAKVGFLHGEPATRLVLLRRLLDLDLMATVRIQRVCADDPLFTWVGGPRGTGDIDTYDSTWLRLLDLEACWPLRTYTRSCEIVVEVSDTAVSGNAGRWRLVCRPDGGEATRTDAPAEVSLDISVLGAGFLGRNQAPLLRAGAVTEHRTGAFAELAEAMRGACEPEPSMAF